MILKRKIYSKKEEPKLKRSDRQERWALKNLNSKKDREALIEAYDNENGHKQNGKPLAKQNAKMAGAIGGTLGAGMGYVTGGKKGALIGAGLTSAVGAGGAYVGARVGVKANKVLRKNSGTVDSRTKRTVDLAKLADGKMSESEFVKKWGGNDK